MIENLKNNSTVWLVLSLCSLIGVPSFIFAIYTWCRGKTKKELSFFKNRYQIVESGRSSIPKFQIFFSGKEINDLTITKFAIWNSGNDVIRREDMVSDNPLCIKCKDDAKILDAKIIAKNEDTNRFSVHRVTTTEVEIDFEYVDKREGIVLQIMHSGDSSDLFLDYKIKGGKKITARSSDITRKMRHFMRQHRLKSLKLDALFLIIEAVFMSALLVGMVLTEMHVIPKEIVYSPPKEEHSIFTIIFAVFAEMVLVTTCVKILKKIYHIGVPVELRKYVDIEVATDD